MPLAKPREGDSVDFHVYPAVSNEGTLGNPETVIWAAIRHLCSRNVGEGIAGGVHGIGKKRDREDVARNLKLYIRQANEFYEAAVAAKPNTAPLIYYYSFLNLAKGLCELRQPRFHTHNECYRHGISWRADPQKLVDPAVEVVSITGRGVWHVLWEAVAERACPAANPTRLRIRDLFSYCPEVSIESSQAFGRSLMLVDMEQPDVLLDKATSEAWLRFSGGRADLNGFRISARELIGPISTPRSGYIEVKSSDKEMRAFQSATPKKVGQRELVLEALHGDILALNAFAHLAYEKRLKYFLPLQSRLPLVMPQLMVYYTILFWLGSLVRYDPHSLNALIDSQYWLLIDGFMSQSRLWLLELFEWAFYRAETTLWITR